MVTEITDPVVLSTIVQTAVLTLTLLIFAVSFRSQNKANKEAAYQKVLDDYTDSIKMLIERPELTRLQQELARMRSPESRLASRTPEEMTVRSYILLIYGIFERAHLLYRKKWIDKEAWDQWDMFLKTVAQHPLFQDVHRTSAGMFDKPFMDYVTRVVDKDQSDSRVQ